MSEECDLKCKVVLIGESGVGKTSIFSRYIEDKFEHEVNSTASASFLKKYEKFNNKLIEIDVWDTAGQEQYRSFTNLFYKNAKIVLLVYDMTNRKSFENIKNYWYKQVKENTMENVDKFIINLLFFYNYSYWNCRK
jgi:small GTP-binding protein